MTLLMDQFALKEQFAKADIELTIKALKHYQYHLDDDSLDYSGQYANLHTIISKLLPLTYTNHVPTTGQ
jgi:hypothetical protein